jgi:glycosyltransferase involved in cell wall biosynthesis
MKIVFVLMEGKGGMYQYGVLLANALAVNHQLTALVPSTAYTDFFDDSVKVIRLPAVDTKARAVMNTLRLDRLVRFYLAIKAEDPDVIHFHNPYNPWTLPLLPWLRKYGIVITIPEGFLHAGMDKRLEMKVARQVHIRFADAIIALYERDREMIVGYARGKKIFIVPHGENTLFHRYARPDVVEENAFLFFGGIAPFKGLDVLLRAFPLIREQAPGSRLIIAGGGSLKSYQGLLDSSNEIEIHNRFIPQDEVAGFFQQAKLVVMPYVEEDHSAIIPIAYSFGKPVVVSELVSDMVEPGRTGLVVPPRDEAALAEAVVRLLQDEALRRQMGRNAKAKVRTELSWDRLAEDTLQAYRFACQAKGLQAS